MHPNYVVSALAMVSLMGMSAVRAAEPGFYVGLDAGRSEFDLNSPGDTLVVTQGVVVDTDLDRTDRALAMHVGYTFNKHFSLELAYADLGEARVTTTTDIDPFFPLPFPFPAPFPTTGNFNALDTPPSFVAAVGTWLEKRETTLDPKSLSLSLLGEVELARNFSLIGRAGIAVQRIDSDMRVWLDERPVRVIGYDDKQSMGSTLLGLGAQWSFHPKWNVRLEADRMFAIDDGDFIGVSMGDATLFSAGINFRF